MAWTEVLSPKDLKHQNKSINKYIQRLKNLPSNTRPKILLIYVTLKS